MKYEMRNKIFLAIISHHQMRSRIYLRIHTYIHACIYIPIMPDLLELLSGEKYICF